MNQCDKYSTPYQGDKHFRCCLSANHKGPHEAYGPDARLLRWRYSKHGNCEFLIENDLHKFRQAEAQDVELLRFFDWLTEWRNVPAGSSTVDARPFLKELDLKRIWLEGIAKWHLEQLSNGAIPDSFYRYHSEGLRMTHNLIETIPQFQPTYLMR